jgi:hypothetical protein
VPDDVRSLVGHTDSRYDPNFVAASEKARNESNESFYVTLWSECYYFEVVVL